MIDQTSTTAIPNSLDASDFFARKFCISLDRRKERWSEMQTRFCEAGIEGVSRFSAIDGETVKPKENWRFSGGAFGCLQSNLRIVEQARDQGWPSVLIFEDDVVFDSAFADKLQGYLAQVPEDWDMIFFGCMHRNSPTQIAGNVFRLNGSTSTYAYALRDSIYSSFIDSNRIGDDPVDVTNQRLQERFNCYCFLPHLAWVEGGQSDTHGRPVNPWWLKESMILGGPEMDDIERRTLLVVANCPDGSEHQAQSNLIHVVRAYRRLLPHMQVVVADRINDPGRRRASNTECCDYISLDRKEAFDSLGCLREAVKHFGQGKDFLALSERDFLPSWDIKAGLRKCDEYDVVSPFERVIAISEEETTRLINQQLTRISGDRYVRRNSLTEGLTIFSRRGFEVTGEALDQAEIRGCELKASDLRPALNVFEGPGWAVKLYSGWNKETAITTAGR